MINILLFGVVLLAATAIQMVRWAVRARGRFTGLLRRTMTRMRAPCTLTRMATSAHGIGAARTTGLRCVASVSCFSLIFRQGLYEIGNFILPLQPRSLGMFWFRQQIGSERKHAERCDGGS